MCFQTVHHKPLEELPTMVNKEQLNLHGQTQGQGQSQGQFYSCNPDNLISITLWKCYRALVN